MRAPTCCRRRYATAAAGPDTTAPRWCFARQPDTTQASCGASRPQPAAAVRVLINISLECLLPCVIDLSVLSWAAGWAGVVVSAATTGRAQRTATAECPRGVMRLREEESRNSNSDGYAMLQDVVLVGRYMFNMEVPQHVKQLSTPGAPLNICSQGRCLQLPKPQGSAASTAPPVLQHVTHVRALPAGPGRPHRQSTAAGGQPAASPLNTVAPPVTGLLRSIPHSGEQAKLRIHAHCTHPTCTLPPE